MLPPLATIDDILARAPELRDALDEAQAETLITDASAIIRSSAGRNWVSADGDELEGVPDGIPGVCAMMVIRALRIPDGVTQESVGNWSVSYASAYATDRLYLTRAEKQLIRGASAGAFGVNTYGAMSYLG